MIYISRDNTVFGPYSESEAYEHFKSGHLLQDDLACREGANDWKPLLEVLFQAPNTSRQAASQKTDVTENSSPILWNPVAAINWLLVFSPIFSSALIAKNYETLGKFDKARKCWIWCWVWCGVVGINELYRLYSNTLSGNQARNDVPLWFAIVLIFEAILLLIWHYFSAWPQASYIKKNHQKQYTKKSWKKPLLIGFAVLGVTYSVENIVTSLIFPVKKTATSQQSEVFTPIVNRAIQALPDNMASSKEKLSLPKQPSLSPDELQYIKKVMSHFQKANECISAIRYSLKQWAEDKMTGAEVEKVLGGVEYELNFHLQNSEIKNCDAIPPSLLERINEQRNNLKNIIGSLRALLYNSSGEHDLKVNLNRLGAGFQQYESKMDELNTLCGNRSKTD